ncbi:MAG TPA: acyl-CoA dehydrogenase family protein [Anaerolineae bacterium]|nr:acyl-CoA dehydrogenase family protein [Anaerolineae bacterium]HOR01208.1 acyl-CoA dehydrogenase family protein [Anaerolineae bacterium]
MDFALSDEHLMVQKMVRDFAAREIAPTIKEHDRAQQFDRSILPKMAAQGILGICIPVRYGGAGMDYISLGLACEELEYVDTANRVIMSVHAGLNSLTLLQWGTEEQKQKYLVPQAMGDKIATYGLTEPAAGSDAVGIQSTARREGDHYVLNGEKMWISLADVADNFLVFAWTDMEKKRARDHTGITAFIVERGWPGLETGTIHGKLGVRAGNTGSISFSDVPVPAENVLGREGEGFYIAMSALDNGRFTVAWGAAGLIRACLDASVRYAKERKTFGVEIGRHQLVQQLIAFMQMKYDAAQLLCLRAAWLKNQGVRNTRETALAKWYATVGSFEAAADAVEVHGAYGYSDEYDVERFLRNSKGAVIYEGSQEIQQLMQAQYALGYRKDKPLRCELPAYDAAVWQEE